VIRLPRERLIEDLLDLQDNKAYLDRGSLAALARERGLSEARTLGVASFYSGFRFIPRGRHEISVCTGTACYVKGSQAIYDAFRSELGIRGDEDTDRSAAFTVRKVACLGCCMMAPAVKIDERIRGNVGISDIPGILREAIESESGLSLRPGSGTSTEAKGEIRICVCSSCRAAGAADLRDEILSLLERPENKGLRLREVACDGASYSAPRVEGTGTAGESRIWTKVRPRDAEAIVEYMRGGDKARKAAFPASLARFLLGDEKQNDALSEYGHATKAKDDFIAEQVRVSSQGAGTTAPLNLTEYKARGGLLALAAVLGMDRAETRKKLREAGLRGRGGAGFSTGKKWEAVAEAIEAGKAAKKSGAAAGEDSIGFVICNGDEGDPGAFMDRMIMESFPFRVIEGMLIAAHATGAGRGIVYVRSEYPLALERMRRAEEILRGAGAMDGAEGKAFELEIARGAGAFVCGEETALIRSVSGERGEPRARPPFPSQSGFRGEPTLVNNVETFALVPSIFSESGRLFGAQGSAGSPGTKAFALAGKVLKGGLVEVPMGTSLEKIVNLMGGGAPSGQAIKAVQIGGPSGGMIASKDFNVEIDFEALAEKGAMMGSGGLVALGDGDCLVDIGRYFIGFLADESCGRCVPCRAGLRELHGLLSELCEGRGGPGILAGIEGACAYIKAGSRCGLGKNAPNPVLSGLEGFRSEYEEHAQGRCPEKKCRSLIKYRIGEGCIGCTRCHQACPEEAVPFTPYARSSIDQEKCTRCGLCKAACPVGAIKAEDA
jgi:NADH:ubiquinone oxidoreductase subunit F (NADH-binding)/NADH:ubiquinone oxidoreductase subunit E/NAD-dependent dihydropyrimidine dehydrogenase PreA subunit